MVPEAIVSGAMNIVLNTGHVKSMLLCGRLPKVIVWGSGGAGRDGQSQNQGRETDFLFYICSRWESKCEGPTRDV